MSIVKVPATTLNELCKKFFEKENQRVREDNIKYREGLCTKRRLFGLLKPKHTKEEVDSWEMPTIYDSMSFQRMFPHHDIAELWLAAGLAIESGISDVLVDCKVFNYLDGSYKGWGK